MSAYTSSSFSSLFTTHTTSSNDTSLSTGSDDNVSTITFARSDHSSSISIDVVPANLSFPPNRSINDHVDSAVNSQTITLALIVKRCGDNICHHSYYFLTQLPVAMIKIGMDIRSEQLHGRLIGIEEVKNDMVVFVCREDNRCISFVIVKQQDAKLPWHWKFGSTLRHIANRWRTWKLERRFGQCWVTETIVFHPVINTL
jgi:hypothetical protein